MKTYALQGASAIALMIGLSVVPSATAQQTTPAAPQADATEQDSRRDVVVVTAQKREETVQDIGIAVTAISSETREEIGLTTLTDLTNFAPGLTFAVATDRIGMRGVNRNSNSFGIRTGVSNYVDGVYYPSSIIAIATRRPIMLERTEVVRGPQGTLYGRDSIGGAINLISKRPTDEFETQFNIGAGSFETMNTDLSVSGPITDWLRYRVVGSREYQGQGYLENAAGLDSEGYRTDGYNYEVQLEGDIGEDLSWFLRWGHMGWKKAGAPGARTTAGNNQEYDSRLFNVGANAASVNAGFGYNRNALNVTQVGNLTGNPTIDDPFAFGANTTGVATLTGGNDAALEVIWNGPGFDVKYVGGYGFYKYNYFTDGDETAITSFRTRVYPSTGNPTGTLVNINPSQTVNYNEQRSWFSNEINFLSTYDGPVQFIAGLYQYQENFSQPIYVYYDDVAFAPTSNRILINPVTGSPIGATVTATPTHLGHALSTKTTNAGISDSYGVFTQVDWQLDDAWKITGGIRYSRDFSRLEERGRAMCYYTTTCLLGAATVARPGVDLTDTAFSGISAQFPNGAPGVIDATPTNPSGAYTDPVSGDRVRRLADSWNAVTGMLRLDWTPTDDTLIFANYARGYKGGGFGTGGGSSVFAPNPEVDKEELDSYEIGWKQNFPDWYLTVNSDLYFYDYKGYQVPNAVIPTPIPGQPVSAYTAFLNLPSVQTTGFEIETTWAPTEEFQLLLNYGYTNPEIKDTSGLVHSADPLARLPGAKPVGSVASARYNAAGVLVDGSIGQDLDGNILPFSPKNKVSLNALYTFDLGDNGSLTTSMSYNWQDGTYSSIFNRDVNKTPEWDLVNARAIWNSADGHFTVIGFITNLFDDVQYDSSNQGLRRADATAASTTVGGAMTSTARVIPQTMAFCGSSAATTINQNGNSGYGSLAESCMTTSDVFRMPRWGGVELQIKF
jgi:iron complex outermembrane receptor protein